MMYMHLQKVISKKIFVDVEKRRIRSRIQVPDPLVRSTDPEHWLFLMGQRGGKGH
jgi:hypothetical protein